MADDRAAKRKRPVARVLVGAVILVVAAMAGWIYWIYTHPLAFYAKQTRRALDALGLEKTEIQLPGGRLVYWQGGDGPLLVLLHGAGEHAGTWAKVAGPLLEEYRLLIPDLTGHGESEPGDGPLPFGEVVSGFEAFLESRAGDGRPILVGNSMGAWLATLYAHRHPERVERVVAVNGGPLSYDPDNPSLTPVDREAARELMSLLRDPASPEIPDNVLDDIVRRNAAGPIGRLLEVPEEFGEYLLDGHLSEISTPVDLVWGESDRLMSLGYAERMRSELPRARLTPVPACGHIPQAECPKRFVETLLTVLASEPAAEAVPEPGSEAPDEPAAAPGPVGADGP